MSKLTEILQADTGDGASAANRLMPLVYDELRRLAASKMARESGTQTLQPTALVHEAWLRLGGDDQTTWENRTHFFCAAAEAMRRILIDRARRKQARRHGGGQERVHVDELEIVAPVKDEELLAVNDVLDEFARHAPQKAELVKLRYYGGMGLIEAGRVLGISEPTAVRWWTYAKTWLYQAIQESRASGKG
ncbi:MAG: sigma-70 family RNA polymerase sigma factor [Verrucomicrobiales bacterium]|nr:sigma-70 family RNA polymerase sigma factor [Verrucomicrobiales bacterium]